MAQAERERLERSASKRSREDIVGLSNECRCPPVEVGRREAVMIRLVPRLLLASNWSVQMRSRRRQRVGRKSASRSGCLPRDCSRCQPLVRQPARALSPPAQLLADSLTRSRGVSTGESTKRRVGRWQSQPKAGEKVTLFTIDGVSIPHVTMGGITFMSGLTTPLANISKLEAYRQLINSHRLEFQDV